MQMDGRTDLKRLVATHDGHFHVLAARLHHLKQCLQGEFDRLAFRLHQVILVVFLQELSHRLGTPTNGICLRTVVVSSYLLTK